ncbi:hypothetical protein [Metaclostridioides mangenotii]|nr:hypothetical protein [Clostridioides mangenotii]
MNTTNETEELKAEIINMIEEIAQTLSDEELEELYNKVKEVAETGELEE